MGEQAIKTLTIDIIDTDGTLSVHTVGTPQADAQPIDNVTRRTLDGQLQRLFDAERDRSPATPGLVAELGTTLYRLLDGPERALAKAMDAVEKTGGSLNIIVRLRGATAVHPAAAWRPELLTDEQGPLGCRDNVSIIVQHGDAQTAETTIPGRIRYLFLAFSPERVEPVLDFEYEEESILASLAPAIQDGRAVVEVVEDGSLAELERRLKRGKYDVIHLSGHGDVGLDGPYLLMEDDLGDPDKVSPDRLISVLERAQQKPSLLVVSSCKTAEGRADVASMIDVLAQKGVPSCVGWVRSVADTDATAAATDLYDRLNAGWPLAEATAFARRKLFERDQANHVKTYGWATLHLVTLGPGFRLDFNAEPPTLDSPLPEETYTYLGASRMRVLKTGFVGRRRNLQRLGRILRTGQDRGGHLAGASIIGMKGQGKSCLAGRAIARYAQETPDLGVVVIHGSLDEVALHSNLLRQADEWGDTAAEEILSAADDDTARRVERLLRGPWRRRPLVIVLDDFEQNLDIDATGAARLQPAADDLLKAILPACQLGKPKVLITSTAVFESGASIADTLAEIQLGPLDQSDVRKLWIRGQQDGDGRSKGDLEHVTSGQWDELATRLGRNARVLDWARALLGQRRHDEIDRFVRAAQRDLPDWRDGAPDEQQQAELASLFLFHASLTGWEDNQSADVKTFLSRARVYEIAVTRDAFEGMIDDLDINLDNQLPRMANLGLMEWGAFGRDGTRAFRVSPLVLQHTGEDDTERWHRVAAAYFEQAGMVIESWEHALKGGAETIATRAGKAIRVRFWHAGARRMEHECAKRQHRTLPDSFFATWWVGETASQVGDLSTAKKRFAEAEQLAKSTAIEGGELSIFLHALAGVLRDQGDLTGARERLERALTIDAKIYGTEEHASVAASLHELAGVLRDQGDLMGARERLERSLEIKAQIYGTEEHASVAASLHELASVLRDQGDLTGARERLERALEIKAKVHGTEEHPHVAASLHELASVLRAQGDLTGARERLERSLEIDAKIHGTEVHLSVAASLHELAAVLRAQGDLTGARERLERSLEIQTKIYDTEEHPNVATSFDSLGGIQFEVGDADAAIASYRNCLAIRERIFRTRDHYMIAETECSLAIVLFQKGEQSEGMELITHALPILMRTNQNHPYIKMFLSGGSAESDPS